MGTRCLVGGRLAVVLFPALCLGALGCRTVATEQKIADSPLPRESERVVLPDYVVEPPDILAIDALSVSPKPPYRVAPQDALLIQVANAFPNEPIAGLYPVEPDGTVNLGLSYGAVRVAGLTIEQAREAIDKHLKPIVKEARAVVSLGRSRGLQQIRGQHLVTPDGKVRLGVYGAVTVAGLTVPQVKAAVEHHLSNFLQDPEVSVDVVAYNSKVIYIVFDGAGSGQQIVRQPVTGNDTVLDVMAQAGGLGPVSSKDLIWVARPTPAAAHDLILPVDWVAITERGRTTTNYQLIPGDRIYVKAAPLVTADNYLARLIAPLERISGILLLGESTYASFRNTRTTTTTTTSP